MKIILFTLNQVYANKLVKDLIREFGSNIKLIVEPKSQLKNISTFQILRKYLGTSGAYYTTHQSLKLLIYKIISKFYTPFGSINNRFVSYKRVAKKEGVRLATIDDVNSKAFTQKLKKFKPDIIVSVLFSQILKENILKIPKKGTINIHPAFLPNYKGISPIFWSLVNKEKYSGVSIHYINQGIDTGPIIKRKKIKISAKDTEDSLYWKCANAGSKMLIDSIKEIDRSKLKLIKNEKGSYFSFPTTVAVSKYRKLGRRFYHFFDLFK